MSFGITGVVLRGAPTHWNSFLILTNMCEFSDHVKIGIGSSNMYDVRTPWSPEQREDMIRLALKAAGYTNFECLHIPDFGHDERYRDGSKWGEYIHEHFGKLSYFVSGNEWVMNILKPYYSILHPRQFIPPEQWQKLKGSEVRLRIAKGEAWRDLVPPEVFFYLTDNGLDVRFKKEFGKEAIKLYDGKDPSRSLSLEEEQANLNPGQRNPGGEV